jgi:hypothetical protein
MVIRRSQQQPQEGYGAEEHRACPRTHARPGALGKNWDIGKARRKGRVQGASPGNKHPRATPGQKKQFRKAEVRKNT